MKKWWLISKEIRTTHPMGLWPLMGCWTSGHYECDKLLYVHLYVWNWKPSYYIVELWKRWSSSTATSCPVAVIPPPPLWLWWWSVVTVHIPFFSLLRPTCRLTFLLARSCTTFEKNLKSNDRAGNGPCFGRHFPTIGPYWFLMCFLGYIIFWSTDHHFVLP